MLIGVNELAQISGCVSFRLYGREEEKEEEREESEGKEVSRVAEWR